MRRSGPSRGAKLGNNRNDQQLLPLKRPQLDNCNGSEEDQDSQAGWFLSADPWLVFKRRMTDLVLGKE